jgi:hypothetical protein
MGPVPEREDDLLKILAKKNNIQSLALELRSSAQKRRLDLISDIIKGQKCLKHISLNISGNFGIDDTLLKQIAVVLQDQPIEMFSLITSENKKISTEGLGSCVLALSKIQTIRSFILRLTSTPNITEKCIGKIGLYLSKMKGIKYIEIDTKELGLSDNFPDAFLEPLKELHSLKSLIFNLHQGWSQKKVGPSVRTKFFDIKNYLPHLNVNIDF